MDVSQLSRVAVVAKLLDIKRSTIKSAIERGEIAAHESACGLPMVRLSDVEAWASVTRKRGPKPLNSKPARKRRKGG
jgi:hypothetical protein